MLLYFCCDLPLYWSDGKAKSIHKLAERYIISMNPSFLEMRLRPTLLVKSDASKKFPRSARLFFLQDCQVASVRSVIFVTEATGVDTMSDGCEGCVTQGDGCNCGPQGWPCRGCVNQTSSRLLSLMVSGSSCATCHGYYGSANGQPVCPTCHAFLYANDVDVEANAQVCPLARFFRFAVCLK